jgi:hypothetical protein
LTQYPRPDWRFHRSIWTESVRQIERQGEQVERVTPGPSSSVAVFSNLLATGAGCWHPPGRRIPLTQRSSRDKTSIVSGIVSERCVSGM